MAETLLRTTSTLIVKVPSIISLPPYKEKSRVQKNIIKSVIQCLQSNELELVYVGLDLDLGISYKEPEYDDSTIITINVLEDNPARDLNTPRQVLLKSFKKELQYNNEHILIDKTAVKNGKTLRKIEIYIKSRSVVRRSAVLGYTFSNGTQSEYSRSSAY